MADRKHGMTEGCRALLMIGVMVSCATAMPSVGNAAVEARRIPLPVGDVVTVVKPPFLGLHATSYQDDTAVDVEREARLRMLSALADRLEQGDEGIAEAPLPVVQEIVLVPVYLQSCQTGLFGRIINAPCFERLDATIPNRR